MLHEWLHRDNEDEFYETEDHENGDCCHHLETRCQVEGRGDKDSATYDEEYVLGQSGPRKPSVIVKDGILAVGVDHGLVECVIFAPLLLEMGDFLSKILVVLKNVVLFVLTFLHLLMDPSSNLLFCRFSPLQQLLSVQGLLLLVDYSELLVVGQCSAFWSKDDLFLDNLKDLQVL